MTLAIGWLHDGGDTVGTWLHDAGDWQRDVFGVNRTAYGRLRLEAGCAWRTLSAFFLDCKHA